jgi:beta-glucanase (GH16 family)
MNTPLLPLVAGLLGSVVFGFTSSLHAAPPDNYRLVFNDEFDGPALDATKWNTTMAFAGRQGGRYHNVSYLHYLLDDDVMFNDGLLRLRADKRDVLGDDPPGKYQYSAGLITSADKYSFTYGYIEIRAHYPRGSGCWPAFWLIAEDEYWPPEFDIAEYYGNRGVMHYGLCHGTLKNVQWDSTGDPDSHAEEGWHTFALDWSPGHAKWIVDGIVKKEIDAEYVPDVPMYIVLSNGVGGRRGPSGEPNADTPFPNFLEIDYVRVYKPAPPAPIAPPVVVAEEKPAKSKIPVVIATTPAP